MLLKITAAAFSLTLVAHATFAQKSTARQDSKLIAVASFGQHQPIGMAVAPKGNRVFVSFPHNEPFLYGLIELRDGKQVPFPDSEWNTFMPEEPQTHFVNVQDLVADDQNQLWVLDSAPAGANSVFGKSGNNQKPLGQFKLIQIDLATNQVKRVYDFPDLPKEKSALNDVRIDNSKHLAYLSDPALHAIVVLDLTSGKSRIVLQDHPSTLAEPGRKLHLDGQDVVDTEGKPFVSNVNGIALTQDNQYFYYPAINQEYLYRIETRYLADPSLSQEALGFKVEQVAKTGICHGMEADAKGNIYLTVSPDKAIKYVSPDGKLHTLVQDDRLLWPDSLGIGSDGYLYLTCSQVHRAAKYHGGKATFSYPFQAFKVKLP